MLSKAAEDYLKAIYVLHRRDGGPVSTSAIATYLDVKPPTVTSMAEKLEDRGLVDREKYKGVTLTTEGEAVALAVIRHHRLLEAYLTEHLEYDWSEVHAEADVLEHHISDRFAERIAELLGDPTVDPHGDPIPSASLDPLERPTDTRLDEYHEGDTVVVQRVSDRNEEELRYLSDAGIRPDTRLDVVEVAPFGMVTVRPESRENTVSLPDNVACKVHVEPVERREAA